MAKNNIQRIITRDIVSAGSVLLLGDDGQMAGLLETVRNDPSYKHIFDNWEIENHDDVLNGIVRLSEHKFKLVLLNAERLASKTVHAAAAVRRVAGSCLFILYGHAFAETYAKPALKAGADDCLIWPVPPRQLAKLLIDVQGAQQNQDQSPTLFAAEHNRIKSIGSESPRIRAADNLLELYHQLARIVPQGINVVVKKAEELLAEVLSTEWIKICTENSPTGNLSYNSIPQPCNAFTVDLTGPTGIVGKLIISPGPNGQNQILLSQIAVYLGAIIYLAQRDESLKYLATVDELTGAYNRRYFESFMQQVIDESAQQKTDIALLIFDIDEFKHYNDTYGHPAGDQILCQAIKLIKRCCREHDVVGRIGGDEFAVLFWDTGYKRPIYNHNPDSSVTSLQLRQRSHSEMVMLMSNRFRNLMQTCEFPGLGEQATGQLTVSGGLARFPHDGDSVDELLTQADKALLNAKRSGKNRIYLVGRPRDIKVPSQDDNQQPPAEPVV